MHKWTYKKWMGDDRYSWAVFRDGRVYTSGMDRMEAKRLKEQKEREDKNDLKEFRETAKQMREGVAKRMVLDLGHVMYIGSDK